MGRWEKVVRPVFVCRSVCPSVLAFSPPEPERLVGSGLTNIHSMRRNSGKTMVMVLDRSVAHGMCHVRSRKPLHKSCSPDCKLGGLIVTIGICHHSWGRRRWRHLYTCGRHVNSDFIISVLAHEWRVRLRREGHRSTLTDCGKIASSIVEGS